MALFLSANTWLFLAIFSLYFDVIIATFFGAKRAKMTKNYYLVTSIL